MFKKKYIKINDIAVKISHIIFFIYTYIKKAALRLKIGFWN